MRNKGVNVPMCGYGCIQRYAVGKKAVHYSSLLLKEEPIGVGSYGLCVCIKSTGTIIVKSLQVSVPTLRWYRSVRQHHL